MVLFLLLWVRSDPEDLAHTHRSPALKYGAGSRQFYLNLLLWVPRVDRIHDDDDRHYSLRRVSLGGLLRLPIPHAWLDAPLRLSNYCWLLRNAHVTVDVPNVVLLRSLLHYDKELDWSLSMHMVPIEDAHVKAKAWGDRWGIHHGHLCKFRLLCSCKWEKHHTTTLLLFFGPLTWTNPYFLFSHHSRSNTLSTRAGSCKCH